MRSAELVSPCVPDVLMALWRHRGAWIKTALVRKTVGKLAAVDTALEELISWGLVRVDSSDPDYVRLTNRGIYVCNIING